MITHIFFNLHHVLMDSQHMLNIHKFGLAQIMTERFGLSLDIWEAAYENIVADWVSYFADLILSGDEMMRDLKRAGFG